MFIYIDDSGDPGFKLGKGSSDFFAIAAVYFKDDKEESAAVQKITDLKTILGWQQRREFKFRKANAKIKHYFFNHLATANFKAIVVLADKKNITDKTLRRNASLFYNHIIIAALRRIPNPTDLHIYIDGESGCEYRRKVKTFFRKNLEQHNLTQLKYFDSKDSELIQLADMIVGLVSDFHINQNNQDSYHLLRKHLDIYLM